MPATPLPALAAAVRGVEPWQRYGRVTGVRGHLVEVSGLVHAASIGARLGVRSVDGQLVELEATALSGDVTRCLPFGSVDGIGVGARADLLSPRATIRPANAWLGRVIDGLGRPIDGKGPLPPGLDERLVRNTPPPAHARTRVGAKIETGVQEIGRASCRERVCQYA